jgi:hypothetical protein
MSSQRLGLPAAPAAPRADLPEIERRDGDLVVLHPGQALATVRGKALTLADLVARPAGSREPVEMSEEDFQARLERALLDEVTFQAARAQGLEVDAVHQAQLERVRAARARDRGQAQALGATWSSETDEDLALEASHLTGIVLRQQLAARQGLSSATPSDDEVRAFLAAQSPALGDDDLSEAERLAAGRRAMKARYEEALKPIRQRLLDEGQVERAR